MGLWKPLAEASLALAFILSSPNCPPLCAEDASKESLVHLKQGSEEIEFGILEKRVIALENSVDYMEKKRWLFLDRLGPVGVHYPALLELHYETGEAYFDLARKCFEMKKYQTRLDMNRKGDEFFMRAAKCDAGRESVEHILMSSPVNVVLYDIGLPSTSFEAAVRQTDIVPKKRKPAIVFFYDGRTIEFNQKTGKAEARDIEYEKHAAINFKRLAERYSGRIKFVSYAIWQDRKLLKNNFENLNEKYRIRGVPAFTMHCQWDFARGESAENHNDELKLIDRLHGGPEERSITSSYRNMLLWIETNLIKPEESDKEKIQRVYRYYGSTGKLKEKEVRQPAQK